jgi:large subunit ribosomal protein L10
MLKKEKIDLVNKLKDEVKHYKTVGVMPVNAIPDRLLQKIRNTLRNDTKIVFARKNLILKVLESDPVISKLSQYVEGNNVLVLSNKDPVELYNQIKSNKLKLAAKPNQIAPADIFIEAGETNIPPGQGVTDLKAAGIDVQIQKGKVVISKSKVLVPKGAKITTAVSKALRMLEIYPFEATPELAGAVYENLLFTKEVLSINRESVTRDIAVAFTQAYHLTVEAGYVTEYNVGELIKRAYYSALGLGLLANLYEPEVVEKLLAKAVAEALNIKLRVNIE